MITAPDSVNQNSKPVDMRRGIFGVIGVGVGLGLASLFANYIRRHRSSPSLTTLRRPDAVWSTVGLVFAGEDESRGVRSATFRILGDSGQDLGRPKGLDKVEHAELAITMAREPVILWLDGNERDKTLWTSTLKAGTGWTLRKALVKANSVKFTEQRPVVDENAQLSHRLVIAASPQSKPKIVRLQMTASGWVSDSMFPQPAHLWLVTSAATGYSDESRATWYAVGGRTKKENDASIVAIERDSSISRVWTGFQKQSVKMTATSQVSGVSRIFAVVAFKDNDDLMAWRKGPSDTTWQFDGHHQFRGQIQRFHVLRTTSDSYVLGVELADFVAKSLQLIELSSTAEKLNSKLFFPPTTLGEARWIRDKHGTARILAVHYGQGKSPAITRVTPAPALAK